MVRILVHVQVKYPGGQQVKDVSYLTYTVVILSLINRQYLISIDKMKFISLTHLLCTYSSCIFLTCYYFSKKVPRLKYSVLKVMCTLRKYW